MGQRVWNGKYGAEWVKGAWALRVRPAEVLASGRGVRYPFRGDGKWIRVWAHGDWAHQNKHGWMQHNEHVLEWLNKEHTHMWPKNSMKIRLNFKWHSKRTLMNTQVKSDHPPHRTTALEIASSGGGHQNQKSTTSLDLS